jgi:S-disulfanyl-L-cysteine oxidoreductase SoxD
MSRSRNLALAAGVVAGLALAGLVLSGLATAQTQPPAGRAKAAPAAMPTPVARTDYGVGRAALPREIDGWDIDVRPDGKGLPPGKGTAKQGEDLYVAQCASCHGEFGESAGRWPILSGGAGTLASHDPVKSVGSYWPYASTLFDYVRRAMPYGNAQSLTADEVYAITAYVLYLNDVITDMNFELNQANFAGIKLVNQPHFVEDNRETSERHFWTPSPCMTACLPGEPRIVGRARAIDVTPEAGKGPKVE